MMDMNAKLMEETLVYGRNRFQEGQIILYEGKEAKVISVKPSLIIRVEDRVICGAIHNRIELIEK